MNNFEIIINKCYGIPKFNKLYMDSEIRETPITFIHFLNLGLEIHLHFPLPLEDAYQKTMELENVIKVSMYRETLSAKTIASCKTSFIQCFKCHGIGHVASKNLHSVLSKVPLHDLKHEVKLPTSRSDKEVELILITQNLEVKKLQEFMFVPCPIHTHN